MPAMNIFCSDVALDTFEKSRGTRCDLSEISINQHGTDSIALSIPHLQLGLDRGCIDRILVGMRQMNVVNCDGSGTAGTQ